uniref:glycosyltransferase family 4 protein n=1 Tax=Candidatus Electronema sp. TaxID=2698783 RepID=UPI00405788BB
MLPDKPNTFCILTCYYRPKPGGFCKRLFRGINALLDAGHTVHYLAVVPFPIEHPNCHFHRFPWPEERTSGYLFWGCFHLLAPLMLLWLGFRCRIDRAFAFGHTYALFLQPLRLVKRVPLVLFAHGDTLAKHRTTDRSETLINFEQYLEGMGIAGIKVYGVSNSLIQRINARHKYLQPSECRVLRNDIEQSSAQERKTSLPLKTACVGLLERGKNQRFILDVFEEITAKEAQLYLYGVGPDEELLRDMAQEKNMIDRVHFMGWVQSERIWPEVDLLLMPSLHEGAPLAVLEALGNKVAVLASDIPEHAEILPEKCLLPLGNATGWRSRILFLAEEPEARLRELIEEQRVAAEALRFDWDKEFVRCVV